jgi:hypothetical protein
MNHSQCWRKMTLGLFLGVGVLGCPQRTAVWVVEPAHVDNLRFRVANKRGGHGRISIGVFRVDHCGDPADYRTTPLWGAGAGPWEGLPDSGLREIRYGEMPQGYEPLMQQGDTALTLTPGCYTAHIDGTGFTRFEVDTLGRVKEIPPSEILPSER